MHSSSQLLRHLAGYGLPDQVNPKSVVGNETTSNTCFLKSVMHNAIHRFEVIIQLQLHQERGEEEDADETVHGRGG